MDAIEKEYEEKEESEIVNICFPSQSNEKQANQEDVDANDSSSPSKTIVCEEFSSDK